MSRIIAIANQKGGTAKTTSCINIGASLAERGKKVLLVDLDPQANLSSGLGIKLGDNEQGTYELIMEKEPADILIRETEIPGLHIIPSSIMLAAAEAELAGDIGRDQLLRWSLTEQMDRYDYIIIDTPPNLGVLTINSLGAADEVIIPLQPQAFAMSGAAKLLEIIEKVKRRINPNLAGWILLLTLVDYRRNEDKRMIREVRDSYRDRVFECEIRVNSKLLEASREGMAAKKYAASSSGALEYDALALEMLRMHGEAGEAV